jgi:hypothetical protein
MPESDSFQLNIDGARNLVGSKTNKIFNNGYNDEGVGEEQDLLSISLSDEEILDLRDQYEAEWNSYYPKVKPRQKQNKTYLTGMQNPNGRKQAPVASNLLFEATATFVPAALAKNPEPVVYSDNTPAGKQASSDLKTMLQYHAETLDLRGILSEMVWHWSVYFIAGIKYGWDEKTGDVTMETKNPKLMKFDPNGYVDRFGHFVGWLGDPVEVTAKRLIELFPKHKAYITAKVSGKMGTMCTYTEWWDDEMSFSTFFDVVLDKHKNEFFNYPKPVKNDLDDMFPEEQEEIEVHNHFATPQKPYTFLSCFSLQEEPFDITNLIEQNISNQDQVNVWDLQVTRNLKQSNNSLAVSGITFNQEIAHQAAQAMEDGDPILIPDGNMESIKRFPANALPNGLLDSIEVKKNDIRSTYGTQGITATAPDTDQTAHGMVIDSNRDSSRIGGGIGDKLETVAKGAFNFLTQIYYVFYDEKHWGAILGNGAAVAYVGLQMQDETRRFVVSVSPNSMKPKDEITEQNMAVELAQGGWLDPLSFFEKIDDPDPQDSATRLELFKTNPQAYIQTYLTPQAQQTQNAPPQGGGAPPQQAQEAPSISAPASSADISQAKPQGGQQPNI